MNSPQDPRRIIYLAHGGDKYMKQSVYSIYTLLHWLLDEGEQGVEIVVYTDDPASVPQHRLIQTETLTQEALTAYKGHFNYVHRIKLAVLGHAQRKQDGPLIFVDCDTKWVKHPRPAFEAMEAHRNCCFMHEAEGSVSETNHPDYFHALSKEGDFQRLLNITPPWDMWNTGTIGIPGGCEGFFADTLTITDRMLGEVQNRNWVEQMAVSLLATQRFQVRSFEDYLLHFWRDSYAIPTVLDQVLPKLSINAQANAKLCVDFPIDHALAKHRRSIRGRLQRRIAKTKRSLKKRFG